MPPTTTATANTVHDLTALREQIQTNASVLYKNKPNPLIVVSGKQLFVAHILATNNPGDILISGNPHAELADAYTSLLRATALRVAERMLAATTERVGEWVKGGISKTSEKVRGSK